MVFWVSRGFRILPQWLEWRWVVSLLLRPWAIRKPIRRSLWSRTFPSGVTLPCSKAIKFSFCDPSIRCRESSRLGNAQSSEDGFLESRVTAGLVGGNGECYTSEIPLEKCTELCCPFGSWYVVGCHVFFEAGEICFSCNALTEGGGGGSRGGLGGLITVIGRVLSVSSALVSCIWEACCWSCI